uniref:Serine protease n=1 Tax=Helicotheca tamesis TaxID=374047 RepID=A0A7S2H3M8_9STRA|mmetsp:Transcript_14961/g.20391  ORF Transcript_14961/g.20391 Transcript_14961/m.20391 type:complete len:1119 (+) Transcript_14961:130-3486(+)
MEICNRILLQLTIILATTAVTEGQHFDNIFHGSTPIPAGRVHQDALCPQEQLKKFTAPTFDRREMEAEDEINEKAGMPIRFAVVNHVSDPSYSSDEAVWEAVPDGSGTRVWRMLVEASAENQAHHDCLNLNFAFSHYHMPEGAELTIYDSTNPNGVSIGPFTHKDNQDHGELWTPVIPSCNVAIEVDLPPFVSSTDVTLRLYSVNEGYRPFGFHDDTARRLQIERDLNQNHSLPFDQIANRDLAGYCNENIVCKPGWEKEGRSVAAISTGGKLFCTGFMVNNAKQDFRPYFMTAAHCGINNGNSASLVAYWNWKYDTCESNGKPPIRDEFTSGATFVKSYTASDATLVVLNSKPDLSYGVAYAGWDRSGEVVSSAIAIHHPQVDDAMKISFENDPIRTTSYGSTWSSDGTHFRVADWDSGTTEPGSSGSPLFSPEGRVIGQLHGGGAACGNNEPDWYGKFSRSMDQGGFDEWLDPEGTGVTTVDTIIESAGCNADSDCDDGIDCTVDTCNMSTGECSHEPNDSRCNDEKFCNGEETCTATGCQAGSFPCDDGIACTVDTCDEINDTCTNEPNDADCDDDIFCNGIETCSASEGCRSGMDACLDSGFTCEEITETCFEASSCTVLEDFDGRTEGDKTVWSTKDSTCSTGTFEVGTPTKIVTSLLGVTTQVDGDHTTGNGYALYSSPNKDEFENDIDLGTCIATSPSYEVKVKSILSVWYYFGQRDGGDDADDGFMLEVLVKEGSQSEYSILLAKHGDVTINAEWTKAAAIVPARSTIRVRMKATDATDASDLIEAGLDDLSICALESFKSVSPFPTSIPSEFPTTIPSGDPSTVPSVQPSESPSSSPSDIPSVSYEPSILPSKLSSMPSMSTSPSVSVVPSAFPSKLPSNMPSSSPSTLPSAIPSRLSSNLPSRMPSISPSMKPSRVSLECTVVEDFERLPEKDTPWDTTESSCSTGHFEVGTPEETIQNNVVLQVGGDHTTATEGVAGTGHALFSSPNGSRAGKGDIDRGSCIALSPKYRVDVDSTLTIWYFFGQRDGDDDADDGFKLEVVFYENDVEIKRETLASHGDETISAKWTMATTTIPANSDIRVRMEATDGKRRTDIIEAGADDLSICPLP